MAEFIKRFYEKKIRHIMGGPSLSRFFLGADRGARLWYTRVVQISAATYFELGMRYVILLIERNPNLVLEIF